MLSRRCRLSIGPVSVLLGLVCRFAAELCAIVAFDFCFMYLLVV
jgi:hypothetical protein